MLKWESDFGAAFEGEFWEKLLIRFDKIAKYLVLCPKEPKYIYCVAQKSRDI